MKSMLALVAFALTFNVARGAAPVPRPTTDKILVPFLTSNELAQFIKNSNLPLKDAELTSVNVQVDDTNPKSIEYQFSFEYTKFSQRDFSCNFTATLLFDACSGTNGKLSPPIFTDLGCDQ